MVDSGIIYSLDFLLKIAIQRNKKKQYMLALATIEMNKFMI